MGEGVEGDASGVEGGGDGEVGAGGAAGGAGQVEVEAQGGGEVAGAVGHRLRRAARC